MQRVPYGTCCALVGSELTSVCHSGKWPDFEPLSAMAKALFPQRTEAEIILLGLYPVNLGRKNKVVLGKPLDGVRRELDDHLAP